MGQRSPLLPIFLIVLVDILGYTMVFPLLGFYAVHFGATPFVAGLLVSSYAVCSLVSSPILGRLSDVHGRRPILLISQLGTCIGFLMLAGANALWMVFVGRIIDGVTAGNLTIAQAYISDHTAPENRAKAFGVIGIAFGIGFMFGPLIAGQLHKISQHAPFLAAACLSAFSIFCTWNILPREAKPSAVAPVPDAVDGVAPPAGRRPGITDWRIYADFFRRPLVARLLVQFFLFTFAFGTFTSGVALFAAGRFHTASGAPWGPTEVGWLLAFSGLLGAILQGGLIGRLVKRYGESRIIVSGFIAAAIGYVMLGLAGTLVMVLMTAVVAAYGSGVLRPTLTARITQVVGRHEQGTALGISQTLNSIALAIAPAIGGMLITRGWLMAWAFVAAGFSCVGLLVALGTNRPVPARSPVPQVDSSGRESPRAPR